MSELYIIQVGTVCGLECVSQTSDRRCASVGADLQAGAEEAGDPRTADYLSISRTRRILPSKAELETVEFPLPSNFRLGVAYDLIDDANNLLTVAIDGNHPTDNSERLHFGLEYWYKKMASVRGGYKFRLGPESAKDEEGITLGFGINTQSRFDNGARLLIMPSRILGICNKRIGLAWG